MNTVPIQIARRLFAIMVAVIVIARLAVAQDIERPFEAPDVQLRGPIMIGRQGFDLRASGRVVGNEEVRERYETALKSRIESTVRLYGLSEKQKKKLQLAGRGDIKRLFDRTLEARKKRPLPGGVDDKFPPNVQVDRPHRLTSSGELFGEGSLFAKVLKTTVTKEQSAALREGFARSLIPSTSCDDSVGARDLGPDAGFEFRTASAPRSALDPRNPTAQEIW